jgi:hypothetical protein
VLLSKPATNMGQQKSMFHNFPQQMVKNKNKNLLSRTIIDISIKKERKEWIQPTLCKCKSFFP